MIDQWFKKDLHAILASHPVAVFIDEVGDAEFLLDTVADDYMVHRADAEIDELHVKYQIEGQQATKGQLIYTHTSRAKLKFLREYCEIHGCLEISSLQNYIKAKVHQTLNLNINLPKDELITAAKVSVGKEQTYWMDLCSKGGGEIFDLEKELLPFIDNPQQYDKQYDAQLRETFYRKVNELLGQEYIAKPAETLASEAVKAMLDGLVSGKGNKILQAVYKNWLDSRSFQESFSGYLSKYTLPAQYDPKTVSPSHPFAEVDEYWLKEIGTSLNSKEPEQEYISLMSQRIADKQAKAQGITFWKDVKTLLDFDSSGIAYLNSLDECVQFYTKHFYLLDTAIRNLYTSFLNKKELLAPFQHHYKEMVTIFLDKWFSFFANYQEQQTGLLQRIIDENDRKIAIIVGDGVAYEIGCLVAQKVSSSFDFTAETILADIPSETENNMSRIYMANGISEKVHSNREKYLQEQNSDINIEFVKLDEVNEKPGAAQYLICTYKDIDDMGEKLQHKALKYFPETIDFFAEKISVLLEGGYSKVYLITDHGFVLTGMLTEADKITVTLDGDGKKAERYIRTVEPQPALGDNYVETKRSHEDYNYLYFSKTINPFKTPGVYGFSHGGLSPQELVTPYFCWERSKASSHALEVSINNKDDLQSVTGELYLLRIKADDSEGDLFSMSRKICLVVFSNQKQISTSDIMTIARGESIAKEFAFEGNAIIEVQLLDAQTKEQLDRVVIKQNKDRDLGGLL